MSKLITQSGLEIQLLRNQYDLISHLEIANQTGVDKRNLKELIEKYKNELESFGVLRFETAKPMKGTKGGAPETIYLLNEQQSTLLITFMRNNPIVIEFKIKLVKSFFEAKNWIKDRALNRAEYPEMSKALEDSRKLLGKETESHHYMIEAKMIAKLVTGYEPKQYCDIFGIERESFRNSLSPQDQKILHKVQQYNTNMIEDGKDYDERKESLLRYIARQRKLLS